MQRRIAENVLVISGAEIEMGVSGRKGERLAGGERRVGQRHAPGQCDVRRERTVICRKTGVAQRLHK